MNAESNEPPHLNATESIAGRGQISSSRWRWLKWIVAGNPFYPASAVLLLYAVYRFSEVDRMFEGELPQMIFNFASLQMYELLAIGTAVFLWMRGIRYDSLLLVALDGLLMLVPFILITQAIFLGAGLSWVFGSCCAALIGFRMIMARRSIPLLEWGLRFGVVIALLVAVNLALPVGMKSVHASLDAIRWGVWLDQIVGLAWGLGLPVLLLLAAAIAGLQCRPWNTGNRISHLFIVGGVAATGVHVLSLGYVYSSSFHWSFPVPLLWSGLVVVYLWREFYVRRHRLAFQISSSIILICLAMWMSGNPIGIKGQWFQGVLILLFAVQWIRWDRRLVEGVILGASMLTALACLPFEGVTWFWVHYTPLELSVVLGGLTVAIAGLRRREMLFGAIGSVGIAVSVPMLLPQLAGPVSGALLAGTTALLIHSIGWGSAEPMGVHLRRCMALGWLAVAIVCTMIPEWTGGGLVPLVALLVLAFHGLQVARRSGRQWGNPPEPAGAAFVLLIFSGAWEVRNQIGELPGALWSLLAAAGLFAVGTLLALFRRRWNLNPKHLTGINF